MLPRAAGLAQLYGGAFEIIVEAKYEKPAANIILSGEQLKAVPLRTEQDKGVHFHYCYST